MPYSSDAQRKFFHSPGAQVAGIKPQTIQQFDKAASPMKPEGFKKLKPMKDPGAFTSPWVDMGNKKNGNSDGGGTPF